MGFLNTKFYMKKPTKYILRRKGFRYDMECSTKDYTCFTYSFPVDYYEKTPVLICKLRVYLDTNEVDIEVLSYGDGNVYPAWYQRNSRIYCSHKDYIEKIDRNIKKELTKLHITPIEEGEE